MTTAFYIVSAIAIISGIMVISTKNAFSALLYMIISLLAVALNFFLMGAAFAAALEIIIYAGAIMVLFVFVVMMLNLGEESVNQEKKIFRPVEWIGPSILTVLLAAEIFYILISLDRDPSIMNEISPKEVGFALFGKYLIGVELAALLVTAGIVGAWHLGKEKNLVQHRYLKGGGE
jgi:NADH-quinone oxidoreductase subunit J